MQYNIFTRIKINEDIELRTFNSLMVSSSISNMTDTCSILVPMINMSVKNNKTLSYFSTISDTEVSINVGDKITIEAGYYKTDVELTQLIKYTQPMVFIGYIRGFQQSDNMLEILCDDTMYLFKSKKLKYSLTDTTLSELIAAIVLESGIDQSTFDPVYLTQGVIDIGKVRTAGYLTGASILAKIQDTFKLFTYFKNIVTKDGDNFITTPTLFGGLKYPIVDEELYSRYNNFVYPYYNPNTVVDPTRGTEDGYYNPVIVNDLDYNNFNKTDELIVIGTTTTPKNNTKLSLSTIDGINIVTDKESTKESEQAREVRVDINIGNVDTQTLSDLMLDAWNNYPTEGFEGTITTFGEPMVTVGDRVRLKFDTGIGNVQDTVRDVYYVDEVKTTINQTSGFNQVLTIDSKTA